MANLPKIQLGDLKNIFSKFGKNLSWLFFALFVLLLILEAFEIKQSVQIILSANQEPVIISHEKGVRINFTDYDQITTRIQEAPAFIPSDGITKNPFSPSK